jgi:hypothetical protein
MAQANLLPSDGDLNAIWKQLYEAAVLELDDTKLSDRLANARAAMRARADSPNTSAEECQRLSDGFRILRVLEETTTRKNLAL